MRVAYAAAAAQMFRLPAYSQHSELFDETYSRFDFCCRWHQAINCSQFVFELRCVLFSVILFSIQY